MAKPLVSEFEGAVPDSAVALVIGAAGACWLLATLPIAMLEGSKKSLPAATADAATSDVLATLPIAVFNAALRLAAVCAGVEPIGEGVGGRRRGA